MFGLQEIDIDFIVNFGRKYPEIEAIGIFGSRATDKYKTTSDVDIVLYGKNVDNIILADAFEVLENHSPYPFFVDIKHYDSIFDPVFKNEVDKSVKIIYMAGS